MGGRESLARWVCFFLCAWLPSTRAGAQNAPASPSASSAPVVVLSEKEAQARSLYQQAWELEKKGDLEGALELFKGSRRIFPSRFNTYNLARILVLRGKCDEGLEVFESLLVDFATEMSKEERDGIHKEMIPCRGRVGTVEIKSTAGAQITVDGKVREATTRGRVVRLLPGKHQIRVYKAGFELVEQEIEVGSGQEASLDFPLVVLRDVGKVLVKGNHGEPGLSVLIDGNEAGVTPWNGSLKPGRYLVQLAGETLGSLPRWVQVVAGLEVELGLEVEPIGALIRVQAEPSEALLFADGEALGRGVWQGRLPARAVHIEGRLEGYRTGSLSLQGSERGELRLRLEVDKNHEKWKKNRLELEFSPGYGWAPSLRGDSSEGCPSSCVGTPAVSGISMEGRVAYVLSGGVRLEGSVGYLRLKGEFERRILDGGYEYRFQQSPSLQGPQLGAGVGYRVALSSRWEVGAHLSFHGLFGSAVEPLQGELLRGGEQATLAVAGSMQAVRGFDLLLKGRLGLLFREGPWRFGVELGGGGFLTEGPLLERGEVAVPLSDTRPCQPAGQEPWCARGRSDLVDGERIHQRFLFVVPSLVIGWTFP